MTFLVRFSVYPMTLKKYKSQLAMKTLTIIPVCCPSFPYRFNIKVEKKVFCCKYGTHIKNASSFCKNGLKVFKLNLIYFYSFCIFYLLSKEF